ncbi:hypothetical protein HGM15179_019687 [Zosterops borbonicus]|uniref:Rna-directed dna polymerase from mobile element jockey-like n=1 Tax=Zosterops borbonicus TaxID=364589 RepID=A0A8K1FUW1_9PASS|nr:hypothetical protein HGM15179_019687 [Zosterops borbonicus]
MPVSSKMDLPPAMAEPIRDGAVEGSDREALVGAWHLARVSPPQEYLGNRGKKTCLDELRTPVITHAKAGNTQEIEAGRKRKDNVGRFLNEQGTLVTDDTEKAEVLNAFFASVFTNKTSPQGSLTQETRVKEWWDIPLVKEDWVREHLSKLDIQKSVGPEGMHPELLKALADIIERPLVIIFDKLWRSGEVPEDWKKANVTLVFKKGKKEDQGITGQSASPQSLER